MDPAEAKNAATPDLAIAPSLGLGPLSSLSQENANIEQFFAEVSKIFTVGQNEVALLKLEKGILRFVFPAELARAGSIPASSSCAVAAHTAATKTGELFNAFTKVKHASIFETVKLGGTPDDGPTEYPPIQKLMSCPVFNQEQEVIGVVQISRKAPKLASAGPDFCLQDLQLLEQVAKFIAQAKFMQLS